MTTRLKGVLVTFEDDIREDDAEARINAIRCIRGVLSVEPVPVSYEDHKARERVRDELWSKASQIFWQRKEER